MKPRHLWLLSVVVGALCAGGLGALAGNSQSTTPPQDLEPVDPPLVVNVFDPSLSARSEGTVPWRELRDGECLVGFESVDQATFTVVECHRPHQAELVRAVAMNLAPQAPYPGDPAVREFALQHCASWGQGDVRGGEIYDDLVVQPVYSLGAAAWEAGDRLVGCLVYRSGGGAITDRLLN